MSVEYDMEAMALALKAPVDIAERGKGLRA